ncbi:PREDICTED: olfactory receptor 2AJ1-like [Dipodomys ordii]|uniref:Olfactory receptor 2AJ1-like n=1 Tax=Dipodomys ordii TaxID=10020 RepID=A0A1S3F4W7_DIPOR|nr:PREDICTED: olfactory receptor 2AJ1-like [Dipodomys ordii]
MSHGNHTSNSDFILVGLFSSSQASLAFFSCLFITYVMTLPENALMILLIRGDSGLHTPMYFLLSHLSFMDILHTSNTLITDFLSGSRTISFVGCGFQLFWSLGLLGGECLLLAAMFYDHYAAICHPLRYPVLMKDAVSRLMAAGAWLVGTLNSIVHTVNIMHLSFCHSRAIDHFFCEIPALTLSCLDTSNYERITYINGIIFLLTPFFIIALSYIKILHTVFQMKSSQAQKTSLSTCSFHMVVVTMYYGPCIFTYRKPRSHHTAGKDKFLAIFYTFVTAMLNPIIYSFRNKDVLASVQNMLQRNFLYKQ